MSNFFSYFFIFSSVKFFFANIIFLKITFEDDGIINPDILIFGKKSQICGIVATNKYSECMISPFRKLEVTYDGELIDMIRATYILKAFEKYDLLNRAKQNNKIFTEILKNKVLNYRSLGHLISFDFETMEERDQFIEFCYTKKLLCNKSR